MKRFVLLLQPAVLAAAAWQTARPAPAETPLSDRGIITFRITFGEKQQRAADYSGSVSLSHGKLAAITPWRFFEQDSLEESGAWKLRIKLAMAASGREYIPAGVVVSAEAPWTATAQVRTAQGSFGFRLEDLRRERPLRFLDDDVSIQLVPGAERVSGATSEEHDYPSAALTPAGELWVTWQAYQSGGDHVYARRRARTGWPEAFRLTEAKADVFQTAVAGDARGRVHVVWSERKDNSWDLYERVYDGASWSGARRITSTDRPNISHRLLSGPGGALHLLWVGHRDGQSHVLWSRANGETWTAPVEVSGPGAWVPAGAFDSKGNLWVAWDSYRNGNYDVFLRRIAADGAAGQIEQVTRSPRFQAHPSIAVDHQDRVWLAWDEAGANWGKDWNRDDTWRGSTLYADRRVRVAVLESGQWKQPPADLAAFVPPGYRRFVQSPKLVVDGAGRLWLSVQIRTFARTARADFWTGAGRWEHFLTRLDGGRWTPLIPVPRSGSRPEARLELCPAPKGTWMVWANDNRPQIVAPRQRGGTYEIDAATFESAAAATAPALESFEEDAERDRPVHIRESGDVARMRSYRTSAEGVTYQIVRGDFHRHTELSGDGAGDGSLDDYFRYMIDAAQMDTGIIADHNAGGSEYSWWRTEKANDVFMIAGRFTPLFGYERSVNYPNGHRNVIFPRRGVRTLPIGGEEAKAQVNTGPILYPYLKQNRGVCISHSLATGQGTDFRDNDPEVEPVVEIYQGYHASYEYEGAPRADGGGYEGTMPHGPVYPLGFYWRALGKGYKLGTSASSDHISTHSSYTMIYTPGNARGEIVESLRKRRAYGATDNILIDYKATGEGGRTYMMGESFAAPAPPKLWVRVQGTARLWKVEIVKDGRFVYGQEPEGENTEFTFVDTASGKGTSFYYVRVIQMDRNLAWSSPIWVEFRN